jgi:hypothetical protein
MATVAIPVRFETLALQQHVSGIELAHRWGPPIWPADSAAHGQPEQPAAGQRSWMMLGIAFSPR